MLRLPAGIRRRLVAPSRTRYTGDAVNERQLPTPSARQQGDCRIPRVLRNGRPSIPMAKSTGTRTEGVVGVVLYLRLYGVRSVGRAPGLPGDPRQPSARGRCGRLA